MFFRHCQRPSFTPIQNRKIYGLLWEVHEINSYHCTKHPIAQLLRVE
jgi:hypothetical protein